MKVIFKHLWPELVEYKGKIIFVMVLGALISALKGVIPIITKNIIDVAWDPKGGHPEWVWQLPILVTVIWLVINGARYMHLFWMKYISDLIAVKLRRDLMDKYLTLNLGFFHSFKRGAGGLISRMVSDIQIIQNGCHKVADMVREPFMLLIALGYLIYLDWRLTLFIMVTLPIVTGVARNLAKSLRKYGHRNQEAMEELTKTLKESLDGTRIVQSFNLENEMRTKFFDQAENYLGTRRKIIAREEAAGPISESLVSIALAAIWTYIGYRVLEGTFTVGGFTSFLVAITLLQDAAKKVQGGYIKLQQTAVALERLHSIMKSVEVVPQIEKPEPFPKDWDQIEYRNVSFSYGEDRVLNGINLTLHRGEIVALVGVSGGGKSTLVNLLERFFDPSEGEILIGGLPINNMDLKDLRAHIALVSQDVFLFNDTIERNIQLGNPNKDSSNVVEAAKIANAHDFIINTEDGYKSRIGDMGSGFSGGEKQRISIARAVFKDAPILILDEATSALDSASEKEVQEGLDHLMEGRTAFVIAHRLSTIKKADRILVMKEGRVVEQGSHDELMDKRAEYYRFHQF